MFPSSRQVDKVHYYSFDLLGTISTAVHTRTVTLTSLRQPMKLLLTGDPGRSAVLGLPPM